MPHRAGERSSRPCSFGGALHRAGHYHRRCPGAATSPRALLHGGQGPPARWRVMRLQGLTSKHAAHVHLMPPFLNLLHAHSMRSKPVRPCRSLQCILAGATSRQIGPKAPTSGRTTTSAQHTQTRHQLHVISQCGDRLVVMGSISPQRKCVALWVKCMLVGDEITELYIKRQPMDNTVPRHNSRRNEFAQYS